VRFAAQFHSGIHGTTLASDDAKMAPMEVQRRRVSYDDLAQMPEDGRRYELYDGEVFVVPSPIPRHQIVSQRLCRILEDHASRAGGLTLLSPMDVIFSNYDVAQPDVIYFTAEGLKGLSIDERIRRAPDLVVEVLSPSTASNDRGRKLRMFQRYGVPEYWIVDPVGETIEIYKLAESAYEPAGTFSGSDKMRSPILPDLTFSPSSIFPQDQKETS
jgi:Uma2 family endonuclease